MIKLVKIDSGARLEWYCTADAVPVFYIYALQLEEISGLAAV